MATAYRRGCALAPLGAARGAEALNVWEHVAFAEWLHEHRGSERDALEALEAAAFEMEAALREQDSDLQSEWELSDVEDDDE
jgi:hypothetical protein